MYWSMTYDGRPADTTKHTYNQAFAIYGLASYYDASGNREAFLMALELFHIIEEKCLGERCYKEAFTRTFAEASNEKLSENGVMAYHTMNTLLHVMEAYTELYRVMCKSGEAFDGHSLANECENGVVDERRIWWVQAETVLGFLNAYEKSGDRKYREAAYEVWKFIKTYVVTERKPAEWHSEVNRDGSPRAGHPLVDPWKCPYHNGRMCIEIMRREGA